MFAAAKNGNVKSKKVQLQISVLDILEKIIFFQK